MITETQTAQEFTLARAIFTLYLVALAVVFIRWVILSDEPDPWPFSRWAVAWVTWPLFVTAVFLKEFYNLYIRWLFRRSE